jgi:CHAT domain-containing protein/tetratricopeptide (TPR) repeat protein
MELQLALGLEFLVCGFGFAGLAAAPTPQASPDSIQSPRPLRGSDARLNEDLETARHQFLAMDYRDAAETCRRGLASSRKTHNNVLTTQFLIGVANCHLAVQDYREALGYYAEAADLAQESGNAEVAAGISASISSLYLQLGDINSSQHAADRGLRLLPMDKATRAGPPLLIQAATLQARQNHMRQALPLFSRAINMADRLGDTARIAAAWDQLGYEYLRRGQLPAADEAVSEAFRLRKMFKLPDLQYSYYTLGMLRVAQGEDESAGRLLDEAVRLAMAKPGTLPLWRIYYQRGRLRLHQDKLQESLRDLQVFLDLAHRIQVEFLTADSARTSMAAELHGAYSTYIAAAARLHFQAGNAAFARRAFAAAEANRAVSLMAWLNTPAGWRDRLPPDYWTTLPKLQATQLEIIMRDTPAARERLGSLLYRLTGMEAQAGLDLPAAAPPGSPSDAALLARVRQALRPDEVFLSFYLGETESYRWTVTDGQFRMHRLPPASQIRMLIPRYRRALEKSAPEASGLGEQIYGLLFSELPAGALRKPNWLVALDDALFELPLPALVVRNEDGTQKYLIESRSIRIVPSATMLAARKPYLYAGPFVGLADPVYNTADPRWAALSTGRNPATGRSGIGSVIAGTSRHDALQLARLAGSRRETKRCARAWMGNEDTAVILEGAEASRRGLTRALEGRPSIVHLATHFLKASHPGTQALAALSLNGAGDSELLGPAEISRWKYPVGLVVLSGCASGTAAALPGAGLMGMTRAWLAAGAQAVASSLWPAPDDSGELFVALYRHLRRLGLDGYPGIEAEALRRAQLEMIRSGTWRSEPSYWAAFFIVGKG